MSRDEGQYATVREKVKINGLAKEPEKLEIDL